MLDDVKKEKYCQERAAGKSQRKAYLEAFPNSRRWKPETVDVRACKLENDDKVMTRLKELAAENESKAGLTRKNLLDKLESIINTEEIQFKGNEVLKAIEIYASMCGYNEGRPDNEQQREAHAEIIAAIKGARNADK